MRRPATVSYWVAQWVGTLKGTALHAFDSGVAADHLRQGPRLHLCHEPFQVVQVGAAGREEEPVPVLQVVELETDQAGECGSKQSIRVDRDLSYGCWVEIDVVDVPVEQLEPVPHVVAHLERLLGE